MDINMPVMDGLTASNKIRTHFGNMPIIFITGENDNSALLQNVNLITNSILVFKPCSEKTLLKHINFFDFYYP
jgi:CheY-like chemotaxis protein